MEPRFGHDFSQVRVHNDTAANKSATVVNAQAYTVGPHIVFGAGRYEPSSISGKRILAHELAHTIQQTAVSHAKTFGLSLSNRMIQRSPDDTATSRLAPGAGPFVNMPDSPGVKDPHLFTLTDPVTLEDQDVHRTQQLDYLTVRSSASYVDNGIVGVSAELTDIWSADLKSLIFQYQDNHTVKVDVRDIDTANTKRTDHFLKRNSQIYPVRDDGAVAFDPINTPIILLGLRVKMADQGDARRFRRIAAQTVFSFTLSVASLGGAAAGLPEAEFGEAEALAGRGRFGKSPESPATKELPSATEEQPPATNEPPATEEQPPAIEEQPPVTQQAPRPKFHGTSTGDIAIEPDVGLARELRVAEEIGGRLAKIGKFGKASIGKRPIKDVVIETPAGESVKVDVFGPNGELVVVGGPGEVNKLGALGDGLRRLRAAADGRGVRAMAYFEEGTPQNVLNVAARQLGMENVHTFE
jgi:hypothetical protein